MFRFRLGIIVFAWLPEDICDRLLEVRRVPAELHDVCKIAEQTINVAVQLGQELDVRQLVQQRENRLQVVGRVVGQVG